MKHVFLLFVLILSSQLRAQQVEQIKLWPGDAKAAEAEMFVYHPESTGGNLPAILICPGGGYAGLAIDHEGHDAARWFASKGFLAAVLKYRLPHGTHTIPLSDAEKAMEIIRSHQGDWKVDVRKVGVMGSSAGGHLAASLSTLAQEGNRPDFAILFYPVISFDNMTTHGGSKQNLLGQDIDNQQLVDRYSLQKQVDAKTPRTVLLLSDDDATVPTANSILYYTSLNRQHIPASLYMFPSGGHGWGFRPDFTYHEEMKTLLYKWLQFIKVIE